MGITKLEGFDEKVVSMAAALKAIGHPARLSIMQYLAAKDQCICGDIVLELPLAQPTVSRHLAELKLLDSSKALFLETIFAIALMPKIGINCSSI